MVLFKNPFKNVEAQFDLKKKWFESYESQHLEALKYKQ